MQHALSVRSPPWSFRKRPLTNAAESIHQAPSSCPAVRKVTWQTFRANGPFHVWCVIAAFFTFLQTKIMCHASDWQVVKQSSGARVSLWDIWQCVRPTTAEGCHLPSGKLSQTFAFLLSPGEDVQLKSLKCCILCTGAGEESLPCFWERLSMHTSVQTN